MPVETKNVPETWIDHPTEIIPEEDVTVESETEPTEVQSIDLNAQYIRTGEL